MTNIDRFHFSFEMASKVKKQLEDEAFILNDYYEKGI